MKALKILTAAAVLASSVRSVASAATIIITRALASPLILTPLPQPVQLHDRILYPIPRPIPFPFPGPVCLSCPPFPMDYTPIPMPMPRVILR